MIDRTSCDFEHFEQHRSQHSFGSVLRVDSNKEKQIRWSILKLVVGAPVSMLLKSELKKEWWITRTCIRWRSIIEALSLLMGLGVLLTTTRKTHCSHLQEIHNWSNSKNSIRPKKKTQTLSPNSEHRRTRRALRERPIQRAASWLGAQRNWGSNIPTAVRARSATAFGGMIQWRRRLSDPLRPRGRTTIRLCEDRWAKILRSKHHGVSRGLAIEDWKHKWVSYLLKLYETTRPINSFCNHENSQQNGVENALQRFTNLSRRQFQFGQIMLLAIHRSRIQEPLRSCSLLQLATIQ